MLNDLLHAQIVSIVESITSVFWKKNKVLNIFKKKKKKKVKVKVKVSQSCLTLCEALAYTVHGILQARILEWVAVPFSRGSSQPRDRTHTSHIAGGFFTSWATRELREK